MPQFIVYILQQNNLNCVNAGVELSSLKGGFEIFIPGCSAVQHTTVLAPMAAGQLFVMLRHDPESRFAALMGGVLGQPPPQRQAFTKVG